MLEPLLSALPTLVAGAVLGQTGGTTENVVQILFALALIVVVAIIGAIGGLILYRRLTREPTDEGPSAFSLSDLRRMHREGQLSDEEFERARALIIGQHLPVSEASPDAAPPDKPRAPEPGEHRESDNADREESDDGPADRSGG